MNLKYQFYNVVYWDFFLDVTKMGMTKRDTTKEGLTLMEFSNPLEHDLMTMDMTKTVLIKMAFTN